MELVSVCPSYHSSDDIMARGGMLKIIFKSRWLICDGCFGVSHKNGCFHLALFIPSSLCQCTFPAKEGIASQWTSIRTPFLLKGLRKKRHTRKLFKSKFPPKMVKPIFFWGAPHHSSLIHWHRLGQLASAMGSWRKKTKSFKTPKWAPTRCKWSYNPYKWPKIYG